MEGNGANWLQTCHASSTKCPPAFVSHQFSVNWPVPFLTLLKAFYILCTPSCAHAPYALQYRYRKYDSTIWGQAEPRWNWRGSELEAHESRQPLPDAAVSCNSPPSPLLAAVRIFLGPRKIVPVAQRPRRYF